MFEKASRSKLRFSTSRGLLSAEDLWDLPLQALNTIAKAINKLVKSIGEDSFIEEKSSEDTVLDLQFELVKYIIKVKLNEKSSRVDAAIKKKEITTLEGLIAAKEHEVLADQSLGSLKAALAEAKK